MYKNVEFQKDATDSIGIEGRQYQACSVYLPPAEALPARPIVMFAVPGGGYSRGYYDMHFDGHEGYSEAEYHTERGVIFVGCDHVGVGDSSLPDPSLITMDTLAASYASCVRTETNIASAPNSLISWPLRLIE